MSSAQIPQTPYEAGKHIARKIVNFVCGIDPICMKKFADAHDTFKYLVSARKLSGDEIDAIEKLIDDPMTEQTFIETMKKYTEVIEGYSKLKSIQTLLKGRNYDVGLEDGLSLSTIDVGYAILDGRLPAEIEEYRPNNVTVVVRDKASRLVMLIIEIQESPLKVSIYDDTTNGYTEYMLGYPSLNPVISLLRTYGIDNEIYLKFKLGFHWNFSK